MAVINVCDHCGQQFATKQREKGRRFCSAVCYRASNSVRRRVEIAKTLVHFTCATCGKPFNLTPGRLRAYQKQWGKDPKYCSRPCGWEAKRLPDEKWAVNCVQCGKPMPIQRRPGGTINRQKRLCSTACRARFRSERAPVKFAGIHTKGHTKRHGYVWISVPAHASITGKKRSMLKHRYVMEQSLGRVLLAQETVHHINGDRSDNRLENLELRSSRHGPGQRIRDKIGHAIEILRLYPEAAEEAGVALVSKPHAA